MRSFYRIFFLLCLLGACSCKQLLGSNPCTWGPSWWCQNETTANGCGAIDHCIERVWKAATPPKYPAANDDLLDNSKDDTSPFFENPVGLLPVEIKPVEKPDVNQDACDSCKDRVLEIKILIQNNDTYEGFEKILTQDCVKWFSNERACHQIISQSSDEIFGIIRQSSPDQVCDLVLQCGNICDECKGEMIVVEKALSQNVTDQEVVNILIEFCSKLGPYSQVCKAAITSRIDIVLDDLLNFLKNDPCANLGVCSASLRFVGDRVGDTECSFCMFVWEYVIHGLSENQTEQELENVLKKVCSVLGSKFEGFCDNFIDANFDFLIELILNNETPHEFCSQIKVCNSSKSMELATLPRQTPAALLCSALASIAQAVFSTDLVVRSLVQVFYLSCNLLPDETSLEKCQSFVMLYIAGILQLINAVFPISYLCIALLGQKPQAVSDLYESAIELRPSLRGVVECSICEIVLEVVRMDIDTNKSVKEIQDDVNMTCQYLPEGSLRKDCETAVLLVPVVLDLLAHDIQPDEICYYLVSCPNSTENVQRIPNGVTERTTANLNIDLQCLTCKAGVKLTFSFLASNRTQEEIILALNELCSLLSSNSGCKSYLEQLLPPVINYLEQQLSPEEVCLSLGMCQEEGGRGYLPPDESAPVEQMQDVGCFLCSALATLLDDYAESYDEEAVVQVASRLCDQLGQFTDQCKAMVETSLPGIIEKLKDGESAQQLCQDFTLCQASAGRISLSLIGKESKSADSDCDSCLKGIASIEQMLSTEGEDATREYLMEQCSAAYPVFVCKQAISEIISLVKSGEEASVICSRLNLCISQTGAGNFAYIDCDTCERYGKMVENQISENMNSSEFEEVLLDICSQDQIPNCQVYAEMYHEMLYRLAVRDKQNYQEICQELSFCSAAQIKQTHQVPAGANNELCSGCKFIISLAKEFLSISNEQTIEDKLNYVCALVGDEEYDKCKELLDSFIDYAIDIINGDMSVSDLCEAMEACPSQLPTLQRTHMLLWQQLQLSPSTDCTLCTWLSASTHPYLLASSSCGAVKRKLTQKCLLLPTHEQDRCREFLSDDYFVSTLSSSPYSHDHVCQTINICPKPSRYPGGVSLSI